MPLVFVADLKFRLRANHPFGYDAADAGGLQFLPASGVCMLSRVTPDGRAKQIF